MSKPTCLKDLTEAVWKFCPNATVGEDDDGQLVVYTDMRIDKQDILTEMEW